MALRQGDDIETMFVFILATVAIGYLVVTNIILAASKVEQNYARKENNLAGYNTFSAFYPYYLGEHTNQICRRLHIIGTTITTIYTLYAIDSGQYGLLYYSLLIGYGFAWAGHFFFEKNRPATFKHPFFSFAGDYKMTFEVLTGSRQF